MKIIKKKIHGKEARDKMMDGVNQLADVVGSTLGAMGRNVVLDNEYGAPLVINDGVTIANEIFFEDNLMNNAAQLIKDAAIRTNILAGDGTTSSTVLARAILKEGWKKVDAGVNPVSLRKQLLKSLIEIEDDLVKKAKKVETKEEAIQIATVSVQDEELGQKIGSLMFDVGANGAVALKKSIERGVFIEKSGGMRLEGQVMAGQLDSEERWESKLNNPNVLILKDSPEDHEMETKWIPFLKQFATQEMTPNGERKVKEVHVPNLVVVAEKLSKRFIMAMNANNSILKWIWFRPTTADKNMKEVYKDLESLVGGKVVDEEAGVHLSQMNISEMGKAETATGTRHELVLTVSDEEMQENRYVDRIAAVKGQMENAEDEVEKGQIRDRLANLTGGVATIKASGATDQDTNELHLRIEDAINATRSAMEEGYLPGGGVALLNAVTDDDVLKVACQAPIRQILHNAGYDDIDGTIKKLKEGEGVDVLKDKSVDMIKAGIVDPLKVVRLSLIHAVSVAGLLLTSEFVVTNEEDDMAAVKKFFKK